MIDQNGNAWKCQLKLDGYRCLIHVSDTDSADSEDATAVRAFSRRQNDITESLPELGEIDWPSGDYVLDSEVLSSDDSYSATSKRIGRSADNVEREVEMNFALFDVPVFNGENIAERPFEERHMMLTKFVTQTDDDRVYVPELKEDHEEALEEVIEQNGEGLIHKRMDAPYEFDKRSKYWVKEKLDDETIDVTISGFEEGEGKASGTLGKVKIESADGVPLGYSGSGFSDAERDEIWNNKDDWMGRTIEVEGRGLTRDDEKLRMPVFVRDRQGDGEPDTIDRIRELMKTI